MSIEAGSDDKAKTEGEDLVAFDTYKKVLDQHKASQAKAREAAAQLEALKAEKDEADKARMAEQAKFKELWEAAEKKAQALDGQIKQMTASQIEAKKREALKSELGGVRKDDYLKFADLSSVHLGEDGSVDIESVKATANKFREAYPELVSPKSGVKPLPGEAAAGYQPPKPKSLAEMTSAELAAEYAKTRK
jgi:hypothetical protein